jgi:hypothetical protein
MKAGERVRGNTGNDEGHGLGISPMAFFLSDRIDGIFFLTPIL